MKMTPSILLNIVLVTVLATSLFFISTTASTAEYNPWSDIDGDGDIDIYDVVKVTGIYGTSGDPTRNVTVTNFPEEINVNITNLKTQPEPKTIVVCENLTLTAGDHYGFAKTNIEPYRYVSIFASYYRTESRSVDLFCSPNCLNITLSSYGVRLELLGGGYEWHSRVYTGFDAGAPSLSFRAFVYDGSIELTLVIYCYN